MSNNTFPTTLVLSGHDVKGKNLLVNGELPMPDQEQSGEGSATLLAERGFKPKRLRVSLSINYDDAQDLQDLVELAQAVETSGSKKIYNILNITAKAFNIRQVRFTEKVTAREQADKMAWHVTFSLIEHNSVPERIEARQQTGGTAANKDTSETVGTAESPQQDPTPELTDFEKRLQRIDEQLAPIFEPEATNETAT